MVSCVDTVILPDSMIVDEDFWQNKNQVSYIVNNAYKSMLSDALQRNLIVWGDFRSDELTYVNSIPATNTIRESLAELYTLNVTSENQFTSWGALYSTINTCNLVLEKAEGVMAIDPNYTKSDYLADRSQMMALRSLCYFYLVRVFRDVPVTPGVYMSDNSEMNIAQKAPAEVIDMIIEDLNNSINDAVASDAYGDWRNTGYFTKDAIQALLADVYLWKASVYHSVADYQACVNLCNTIIDTKNKVYKATHRNADAADLYNLTPSRRSYETLFGINGQNADESIFELQFNTSNSNTGLVQMYYKYANNSSTSGYVKATKTYATAGKDYIFPTYNNSMADTRFYDYIYNPGGSDEAFDVRKFVAQSGADNKSQTRDDSRTYANYDQNWVIYRLTDVMLMKAEALVQIAALEGEASESYKKNLDDATKLVVAVNKRACNDVETLKPGTTPEELEELVLIERARELCFEGKRWFDLMRYNYRHVDAAASYNVLLADQGTYVDNYEPMLDIVTKKYTSASAMKVKMMQEPYLYMPINSDEIAVNTSLKQNPVYTTEK